ncbi:MAG TPA: AAA family ATPase [Methylomirabilota bacterium]|jgi:predicted ATPase
MANEQAWRDDARVRLTPKAFAVLCHLAASPDRLVTKAELLRAVWPDSVVSDGALTTSIREIRKALRDESRVPRYIETVHRRGYRFIGALTITPAGTDDAGASSVFVGRARELARLERWLDAALAGARQVVFVTGEAGIGKTALVDVFLARALARPGLWLARGQCVEHSGMAEAYGPWLEALGQVVTQRGGERVVGTLRRLAPVWLAQLPGALPAAEREALHREVVGAPPERMLREMDQALSTLSAEHPLVLVLEDLHWSDQASLELLASLARGRTRARLLIVATYRPADVMVPAHPLRALKQELQAHGQCAELALEFLSEEAVGDYVAARFPGLPAGLAPVMHRRTDGNALFLVNVADYLVARRLAIESKGRWSLEGELAALEAAVPDSLREMIERQLERLEPEDSRLLEAASVAGVEFTDAAVASALGVSEEEAGARCETLARGRRFLRAGAEEDWPDGTATKRYAFIHALYRDLLYARLPPSRRVRLHLLIAAGYETAYGARAGEIAATLAVHFEQGRDAARAVKYLGEAARSSVQRLAYLDAVRLVRRALTLLATLPESPERARQELTLQMTLAPILMATKGYAAADVESVYARAEALCHTLGDPPELFPVLLGRCAAALLQARLPSAQALAEHALRLAERDRIPALLAQAHPGLGITLFWRGELATAAAHLEQAIAAYAALPARPRGFRLLHDPGVAAHAYAAWTSWLRGAPEQARRQSDAAVALARELEHPFSLAFALAFAAILHQCRREPAVCRERAEAVISICAEHGFAFYLAVGRTLRGWALTMLDHGDDGLPELAGGLAEYGATGAVLARPYLLALQAEAAARAGRHADARSALTAALAGVRETGERVWESELHRLSGELTEAVAIAHAQGASALELRALTSAVALADSPRSRDRAREALARACAGFHEGFDTPDLHDARAALGKRRG